jgi:hypothetical protein
MRNFIFVLWVLLCSIAPAAAQVSVGVGLPGVSIGINVPVYPQLVPVPGYPVYYAPQLNANYFFYDGMYWVYDGDNWYASEWYNGPWELVSPEAVPPFILRVPVRYYRRPPTYFRAWSVNAPPRWGEHWGHTWEERRRGWDHWSRSAVPAAAPLPSYQRQYSGNRYPRIEQQQVLQSQNYRYQPHDPVAQRHYQAQQAQSPEPQVQTPRYRGEQAQQQQRAQQQAQQQQAQQQQRAQQQAQQQQAQQQQRAQQQAQQQQAQQQQRAQQQAQQQQRAEQQAQQQRPQQQAQQRQEVMAQHEQQGPGRGQEKKE